jgi:hypothetical protein
MSECASLAPATVPGMAAWEIWRRDDSGGRERIGVHHDRIEALAEMLALEAGAVDRSSFQVNGPADPACRTNRELHSRLVAVGEEMNAAERCACRKPYPCTSGSMPILVEDSAKALASSYVEASDLVRVGDRRRQRPERAGIGDALMGSVLVVEGLELTQGS